MALVWTVFVQHGVGIAWVGTGGCCAVVDCTISVNRCHDSIAFVVLLLDHLPWTLMAAKKRVLSVGEEETFVNSGR